MKEDKENQKEVTTQEKFFWIIGIAVIVFLVLLLGSLIGLKITRDKVGSAGGKLFGKTENYEVLEDGLMRNINQNLTRAEIDVENIRFSHFAVSERNVEEEENGESIDCDITFNIENMNEEPIESAKFIITLLDSQNNKIIDFLLQLDDLPAREPILFRQNLSQSCVNAGNVTVEKIG